MSHYSTFPTKQNYVVSTLMSLMGLEDTKNIIIENGEILQVFLVGEWRAANQNKAFAMNEDYKIKYSLPAYSDAGKTYTIDNSGVCSIGNMKTFRFSILNKDSIVVHCYKDGKSYTLYRQ